MAHLAAVNTPAGPWRRDIHELGLERIPIIQAQGAARFPDFKDLYQTFADRVLLTDDEALALLSDPDQAVFTIYHWFKRAAAGMEEL